MDSAEPIHGTGQASISFISCWRDQRQVLRNDLARLLTSLYLSEAATHQQGQLGNFCNNLMDYTCAGHFVIYHELTNGHKAPDRDCRALQYRILGYIGNTTDQILQFNEVFESMDPSGDLPPGQDHLLVKLARVLLMRFALEEQLMELGHAGQMQTADIRN